jgi:hypothetical protein
MDLDQIELHDAIIIKTIISYPQKIVAVELEYYPNGNNSQPRVKGRILFSGVSQYSEISNLDRIENHARAGNVSYWVPADGKGTTYIYLARGFLSITAAAVIFEATA